MKIITYKEFCNSEIIDESLVGDAIENIKNKIKNIFNNDEDIKEKIGKHVKTAKNFNKQDIQEFILKYFAGKGTKLKIDFFNMLNNFLMVGTGSIGIINYIYEKCPEFKNMVDKLFDMNKPDMIHISSISILIFTILIFVNKIVGHFSEKDKRIPVRIKIVRDYQNNKQFKIDFEYFYDVSAGGAYKILYNSFVRKIEEYENVEGFEIEYGNKNKYNDKLSKYNQHMIKVNFYPEEFIELLDNFYSELKNSHKYDERVSFEREYDKNSGNYEFYISRMMITDLIELSERIKKLKLEFHPIPSF